MRATGSGLARRIWSVVGDCSTVGSPGLTRWSIGELEYWIPSPHYPNTPLFQSSLLTSAATPRSSRSIFALPPGARRILDRRRESRTLRLDRAAGLERLGRKGCHYAAMTGRCSGSRYASRSVLLSIETSSRTVSLRSGAAHWQRLKCSTQTRPRVSSRPAWEETPV